MMMTTTTMLVVEEAVLGGGYLAGWFLDIEIATSRFPAHAIK